MRPNVVEDYMQTRQELLLNPQARLDRPSQLSRFGIAAYRAGLLRLQPTILPSRSLATDLASMAADPAQLKQLMQLRPIEQAAADMGRYWVCHSLAHSCRCGLAGLLGMARPIGIQRYGRLYCGDITGSSCR
jgi:hypothetical protein